MKVRLLKNNYCEDIPKGTIMEVVPGMEADATDVFNVPAGMCYLCRTPDGGLRYIFATNVEIVEAGEIDWEQRRYEIAKRMLPSLASRYGSTDQSATMAIQYADALIRGLKKEERK